MLLKDLQKYIEGQMTGSSLPVDLIRIAKSVGYRHYVPKNYSKSLHDGFPNSLFTLVVDGECCLDRLYGGFFSDWICGGQWARMVQFLNILVQTIQNNNIELTVFLNGSLEKERFQEWTETQSTRRKNINSVLRHLANKNTPPPKVWWASPFGLHTCLRFALRQLGIHVVCTMDDHRQEVIAFCRDNDYHGLLADDVEYVIFDPPRYFSSQQLKLTYKGSLETKEFILNEVSKGFSLPRNYFCFLAALLGNFILSEDDLMDFYRTLIPNYDKSTTENKDVIEALTKFVIGNCDMHDLPNTGAKIFGDTKDPRVKKFCQAVNYYGNGMRDGYLCYPAPLIRGPRDFGSRGSKFKQPNNWVVNGNSSNKNQYTANHQKESAESAASKSTLPPIPNEVMRTASERHHKALMSPWIYQVLNYGEIKFDVPLQDEKCSEFPNAVQFYQRIRQLVYAVLFNLHHHIYMARKSKEEGKGATELPDIEIKEWVHSKGNAYHTPTSVKAVAIDWAVPTVQRLWFGSVIDDKKRRLRAFLSCVASDSPLMLNTNHVPQELLIMAAVLRYIMCSNDVALLRKQELDSFIITAFSSELRDADYLQELKLPSISSRGCQLASFFMVGVEMVLFANDACGSPIPWMMCCPWLFFDGKLFHSILHKAEKSRTLMELCEGNTELVRKVERCRQAILEGLWPNFILPNPPLLPYKPVGLLPPRYPYVACSHLTNNRGSKGRNGVSNRLPQSNSNRSNHLYSRGGHLQVAGVVVGSWGPNYGSRNVKNGYSAGPDCSSDYMYNGNSSYPPVMRNKFHSPRGRPSVLAKRRQIKSKEANQPIASKSHHKVPAVTEQPHEYPEDGSSLMNGNSNIESVNPVLHHSDTNEDYSYDHSASYNQLSTTADAPYTTPNNYNAYPDVMHLPPASFTTPPLPPPAALHHPLPPMGLHAQNLYGTQSNGFKSPDSGVNVSIME